MILNSLPVLYIQKLEHRTLIKSIITNYYKGAISHIFKGMIIRHAAM